MSNLNISVNLAGLQNAVVTTAKFTDGEKECIVIPVKDNSILKTKKGGYFLGLNAYEDFERKFGKTHLIRQVLPLDLYRKYKENHRSAPIIGSVKVAGTSNKQQPTDRVVELPEELSNLPF